MNKKLNKKLSAGTKADSSTKDEDLLSSPANAKPNVVGSQSRVVSLKKMSNIWLSPEYMNKRKQSYETIAKMWVRDNSSL